MIQLILHVNMPLKRYLFSNVLLFVSKDYHHTFLLRHTQVKISCVIVAKERIYSQPQIQKGVLSAFGP